MSPLRIGGSAFSAVAIVVFLFAPTMRASEREWARHTIGSRLTDLLDVSGTSSDDVFVVGTRGTVLHFDGRSWKPQTSGTRKTLSAVWAVSPNDVFAVGYDGLALHYDGSGWERQTTGTRRTLLDVWAASPNDVFAVGRKGTILHYDGSGWSQQTSGTSHDLAAVWGTSGSNVYAAGDLDTFLHYDGRHWSPVEIPSRRWRREFTAIGGTSPADVYAAGVDRQRGELLGKVGVLLQFDGERWRPLPDHEKFLVNAISAARRFEVYFSGQRLTGLRDVWRFDGDEVRSVQSQTWFTPISLWAAPTGHVFVVGSGGRMMIRGAPN